MIITKHAYKRARQRLGLNRKAFKRMVDNDMAPDYVQLVVIGDNVVTVKNLLSENRTTNNIINKRNRLKLVI